MNTMNFLYLFICYCYFAFGYSTIGWSGDTLYGAVSYRIIKISQNDAGVSNFQYISTSSAGAHVDRFSWCEPNSCFYGIYVPYGSIGHEIAIINQNGTHDILGPVTVPGETVYFIEGICYSHYDNTLYVTASLDGDVSIPDTWCETLLKVDTASMVGTIVGTFGHTDMSYQPEGDMIDIGADGYLYYIDVEPGMADYAKLYKQDLLFTSPPELMYYINGYNVSDVMYKGGNVYFSINRELRKVNTTTFVHTNIGQMFSWSDYGGNFLTGLTWKSSGEAKIIENVSNIRIFPNPSKGIFHLYLSEFKVNEIRIYSISGQLIFESYGHEEESEIDLSGNKPGIYLIKLTSDKAIYTFPVQLVN